jgi:hypothetical protein
MNLCLVEAVTPLVTQIREFAGAPVPPTKFAGGPAEHPLGQGCFKLHRRSESRTQGYVSHPDDLIMPLVTGVTGLGSGVMLLAQSVGVTFLRRGQGMKKFRTSVTLVALLVGVAGFGTPSLAETGRVSVIFTKGGFVVGVGGGEGVLTLGSKRYPFTVSGMSIGFTIGASTTRLVGRALNLRGPASIEGNYSVIGAGGAVAAGAGGVQLQNANGVILQLSGPKIGAEVSAAVGGVTVRLK